MTWEEVRGQLATLSLLERGWDGDSAYKPTSVAIVQSAALTGYLECAACPSPGSVVPTTDGGLLLEWRGDRWAEARINAAGALSWLCDEKTNEEKDALMIWLGVVGGD